MQSDNRDLISGSTLLTQGCFEFRTIEEIRKICLLLSAIFEQDINIYQALWELMINAMEHGNLEIASEEKNRLIMNGDWEREIAARLNHPVYKGRKARLSFKKRGSKYYFELEDQGKGFDWQKKQTEYIENNVFPSGRGLVIAHNSLKNLTFHGVGNLVSFEIEIRPKQTEK